MRFDPGGFAPEGRSTTDGGEAWCRWRKRDGYSGWYAQGKMDPRSSPPDRRFWPRVLQLSAVAHESRVDQAHTVGPGIVYLGALGLSLTAPADGVLLLHHCMVAEPGIYSQALAPAFATGFVFPIRRVLHATTARRLLSDARIREVFTLGSDGRSWTMQAKDRGNLWCACLSDLLSREEMLLPQAQAISSVLPEVLPADTRILIRLPPDVEGLWNYEPGLQLLWKFTLALGSVDPLAAAHLVASHQKDRPEETVASIAEAASSLAIGAACERILTELRRLEMR